MQEDTIKVESDRLAAYAGNCLLTFRGSICMIDGMFEQLNTGNERLSLLTR